MSELITNIVLLVIGASIMMIFLGFGAAVIMPMADRWNKTFFIVYFLILLLYNTLIAAEYFTLRYPGMSLAQNLISFFETLLLSLLLPMITAFILHCCGEDLRQSRLFRTMSVLWVICLILVVISSFSKVFYYYTADYQFYRGPLYPLLLVPLEVMLVLNLAGVIRRWDMLPKRYRNAFLIGLIPMTTAGLIHFFISVFLFFNIGISIFGLSMIGIIMSDQIYDFMRQQRVIASQRSRIMVLQMRPHFIYNTMMSIYYLCKQDPDLAQQVTLDFTTYLRKNFTAIASEELIPFTDELEHTRAYLAVEQAQFDDSLFVKYDTPHTAFRLPPLILQPIVENAVKHGMDPDSAPLHIIIRTRKTDSGNEIIVENSGADFKLSDDSEPHIALKNIQQRLEMMCRGKIEIAPREGGGTAVKITIPD